MYHCPICGRSLQGGLMYGHACSKYGLRKRERELADEPDEYEPPPHGTLLDVEEAIDQCWE